MKARTVRVIENGTIRTETVTSLEDLQSLVGGYIEAVRMSVDFTVWVNEEGNMQGLAPTLAWPAAGVVLRGPIVFDGKADIHGNTRQLSAKGLAAVEKFADANMLGAK